MKHEEFEKLVETQIDKSKQGLLKKGREYSSEEDRLHNFKVAAELQNCTTAQALNGMLAKHVVSVFDMVNSGKLYSTAIWDEKIGDALNYLLILRAVVDQDQTIGKTPDTPLAS